MSARTRYALVIAGLTLLLAGCSSGGEDEKAPPVATLQSAAAPSGASGGDQRPVYPMDATEAEIKDVARQWTDCLEEKGVQQPDEALGVQWALPTFASPCRCSEKATLVHPFVALATVEWKSCSQKW